jgi:PKD repeat protein
MKQFRILLTLLLALSLNIQVFSQISYGGTPLSTTEKQISTDIDHIELRGPDMSLIMQEDIQDEKNAVLYKIGRTIDVDINMDNSGNWDILNDGRHMWRLEISSKDAQALNLVYDNFDLPYGSSLFIYSPDHIQTIGSYNEKNNSNGGTFATELIYGESLILEYISPRPRIVDQKIYTFKNAAKISINKVNYVYRNAPDPYRLKGFGDSEYCEVNINCSEGNNWQDEKRGIARIYIQGSENTYWCSGSLINNTNEDGTPYFLSAYHCRDGIDESYLDQWIFYFNFEFSGCNSSLIQPGSNTITGASTIADAELDGGSDLLLMELNSTPPSSYNVIYNGWNRLNSGSSSGVGIHHPYGDVKKISTYTSTLTSSTYYGGADSQGASNAHWKVYWAETDNGHGVTEGGSSGSPLFNADGEIVGSLSGGSSTCSSTGSPDLYGKLSYHWTSNGTSSYEQLEPWLDPNGTGVNELGFYDPNNSGVTASFSSNITTITEGGSVSFSSTSTGSIDSFNWSFPGGTPSSSTLENPTITYNTQGTYNVILEVSGDEQTDSHTATNYITVNSSVPTNYCVTLNYPLEGTATFYTTDEGSGFVCGTNSYEDLAKVNIFDYTGIGYVTRLGFHVAFAEGTSSSIKIGVWDEVDGEPGTLLGSKTISMSSITNNFTEAGDYFEFNFDSPIAINGDFFAGIILPGGSDIFALMSNTDGDTNPNIAWEQFSDGSWVSFSEIDVSWELNLNLAIYPRVCEMNNSVNSTTLSNINIYPNPTNSDIFISSDEILKEAKVKIYNSLGIMINNFVFNNTSKIKIELNNLPDGLYILLIQTEEVSYQERIQVFK